MNKTLLMVQRVGVVLCCFVLISSRAVAEESSPSPTKSERIVIRTIPQGADAWLKKAGRFEHLGTTPFSPSLEFRNPNSTKRILLTRLGYFSSEVRVRSTDATVEERLQPRALFKASEKIDSGVERKLRQSIDRTIRAQKVPGELATISRVGLVPTEEKAGYQFVVVCDFFSGFGGREFKSVQRRSNAHDRYAGTADVVFDRVGREVLKWAHTVASPIEQVKFINIFVYYTKQSRGLDEKQRQVMKTKVTYGYHYNVVRTWVETERSTEVVDKEDNEAVLFSAPMKLLKAKSPAATEASDIARAGIVVVITDRDEIQCDPTWFE